MPLSGTFTVGTGVQTLDALINAYTPAWPPCHEFTELIMSPDSGNSGTVAEGDSSVNITSKIYSSLMASTGGPVIKRVTSTGQRIFAKNIYIVGSAVGQVLHVEATI